MSVLIKNSIFLTACTHPNENVVANSLTMREMILAIFRYIDRMVKLDKLSVN